MGIFSLDKHFCWIGQSCFLTFNICLRVLGNLDKKAEKIYKYRVLHLISTVKTVYLNGL